MFGLNLMPKKDDNIGIYAIKALIQRYKTDQLSQVGGQLAYFCILSIFPFLIVLNAIIGILHLPISQKLLEAKELLPPEIIDIIISYLDHIRGTTSSGILSFGLLFTLYLASRSSLSLIEAINKAYKTDVHAAFWQKKIIALIITLTLGATIILSLAILTFGQELMTKILIFFKLPLNYANTWNFIRWSFVIFALSSTLSMVYYILPCKKSSFKLVVPGTIFSVTSFLIMTILFSAYVNNHSNYSLIYGSLGGVIIFMIWLYSSGIIIVLGAELNHILETRSLGIYDYDILENSPRLNLKLRQRLHRGISGSPHHHKLQKTHVKKQKQ